MDELVNLKTEGGQLLQAAIYTNNHGYVRALIDRGVDLDNPPESVPPIT